MSDRLRSVIRCPFCPVGRGVLAVDLDALRAVAGRVEHADLTAGGHPAVVFDPDAVAAGPCAHAVVLVLTAGWDAARGPAGTRPGGAVNAGWRHPRLPGPALVVNRPPGWTVQHLLLAPNGVPLQPRTAVRAAEVDADGAATDSLWWWVTGEALFAADANALCDELATAGTATPERFEP